MKHQSTDPRPAGSAGYAFQAAGIRQESAVRQYIRVFLLALALGFIIYLPFLIMDSGMFVYYGDYNVQQIPFYQMCHDMIRSGETGWNWYTDLGSNFIGSYAFYLMGSPFFWLTIPFPSEAVPYLLAPLMMLKLATAAVTSFGYLKRFVKNPGYAMLGGLMYAFSGYSIYNIFFNHFHEVIAFFPLLLIAMEEFFIEERRGTFALAVGLLAVVNYYFFFGEVIFAVLYFTVCAFTRKEYRVTVKKFLLLGVEAVIGLLMAGCLLLPSIMMVLSNPRLDNWLLGWSGLFYGNEQRYGLILSSLFFPPDVPAYPNMFPDSNAKWSSVSLYLPMFSTVGVIAWFKMKKKDWLKKLLLISLFIALIPILNSAFSLFNSAYYARWFFMPLLLMAAATVQALEQAEPNTLRSGIRWTLLAVLGFSVIAIFPKSGEEGEIVFGQLMEYPERFIAYLAIVLAGLLMVTLLVRMPKRQMIRPATGCLALLICTTSIVMLAIGKGNATTVHRVIDMGLNGSFETIAADTDDVYRIDMYNSGDNRCMDNFPMYWKIPTIQSFHSVVSGSIFTFYDLLGIERNVASRPDISYSGLRILTSCKYLLTYVNEEKYEDIPGHTYLTTENDLDIYTNDNYVPMGFAYSFYLTDEDIEQAGDDVDCLLLNGVYLSDEQIEKYSDILFQLPDALPIPTTEEQLSQAANRLRDNSCDSFIRDKTGFTASFTDDTDRLVFFSVPWDAGWSATVNGEPVEIENVSGGMMAVRVPAGTSEIRFDYRTPGLTAGFLITLGAFVIWGMYLWLVRRFSPRSALLFVRRNRHGALCCKIEEIPLEGAYIRTILSEAHQLRTRPRTLHRKKESPPEDDTT